MRSLIVPAALLLIVGAAMWHTECDAANTEAAEILSAFIAEGENGRESFVTSEYVLTTGAFGSRAAYYRLRALDLTTGERHAFVVMDDEETSYNPRCAPGGAGIVWCVIGHSRQLEQRALSDLRVVRDQATLIRDHALLATGIHEVSSDPAFGELHLTTGGGDYVIVRGSPPEVVRCDDDHPDRDYRPIGMRLEDGTVTRRHTL